MSRTVEQIQFAPRMPKPIRVAAYARVSSGKDAMLHSLAAQVDHYSTYIRHYHGWEYRLRRRNQDRHQGQPGKLPADAHRWPCRKNRSHHHQVHIPLFPEYRDPSGNGAGAEGTGHQRLF